MFDQLKVNQNSLVNLLRPADRDNTDAQSGRGTMDFMSMVLEKTDTVRNDSPSNGTIMQNSRNDSAEQRAPEMKIRQDNTALQRENDIAEKRMNNHSEPSRNESASEGSRDIRSSQAKKSGTDETKSQKNRKEREDESQQGLAEQLSLDGNFKKLTDLIKTFLNGNRKGADESLNKLVGNLKYKGEKGNHGQQNILQNSSPDKSLKFQGDAVKAAVDIKQLIGKEIAKIADSRKGSAAQRPLNDKEIKEIAIKIIDGMKKGRVRENIKPEMKGSQVEELKSDRKNVQSAEPLIVKRAVMPDSASSDKNGSMDKNSARENFSYSGSKVDIFSKGISERPDSVLKNADFRESLQEIIDKARVTVRDSKNGSFTVRLNPQELGSVNVNLVMENGVITGKFLVDSEDAKNMLLGNLNDLKYQLESAGVSVGEFSVNVDNQHERFFKKGDDGSKGIVSSPVREMEAIAASESYISGSGIYAGHINMVI